MFQTDDYECDLSPYLATLKPVENRQRLRSSSVPQNYWFHTPEKELVIIIFWFSLFFL